MYILLLVKHGRSKNKNKTNHGFASVGIGRYVGTDVKPL